MPVETSRVVPVLKNIATRLRIESIRATTAAGSGHPTTCMSAADLMAALFFGEMRYDPKNPQHEHADRLVLSKGHAAPLLYAAWAEAGFIPREHLLTLRQLTSDLEGHPTPRLPFVDVATGSLGQGLCAGIGIALNARRIGSDYRTYVLMGDGETAEGSVWEAADAARAFELDSLLGITDVNGLGQSRGTQFGHDMGAVERRWKGFGWHAIVIDGQPVHPMRVTSPEPAAIPPDCGGATAARMHIFGQFLAFGPILERRFMRMQTENPSQSCGESNCPGMSILTWRTRMTRTTLPSIR